MWAGLNITAVNFIYDAASPAKRERCIAYFNFLMGIGVGLGALTGGYLYHFLPSIYGSRFFTLFLLSGIVRGMVSWLVNKFNHDVRAVKYIHTSNLLYEIAGLRFFARFKNFMLIFLIIFFYVCPASMAQGKIVWHGHNCHQVALTFDDGPSGIFTEKVLDILKKENIKATFFVIGKKILEYPTTFQRVLEEGHQVGNHTYNHSSIDWLTNDKMLKELYDTSRLIKAYSPRQKSIFRPPHGRLPIEKIRVIEKAGYTIVLWTVNAGDFYRRKGGVPKSAHIRKKVLSRTHGGDIILLHDNSWETVNALPGIIKALKKRGYQFVTISHMFQKR